MVAVVGEAGSGKTRLIAEVLDSIHKDTVVLAGACAPFGETNPWAPIATAMFGQIDLATSASAERMRSLSIEKAISIYGFGAQDPLLGWLVEAVYILRAIHRHSTMCLWPGLETRCFASSSRRSVDAAPSLR